MILSDSEILKEIKSGNIVVTPFDREMVGPNTIDFTLNPTIKINSTRIPGSILDCKLENNHAFSEFNISDEGYIMEPGRFYIAHCNEHIQVPNHLCANIEGKSSLARLGLTVHVTAGFVDSGFSGNLVLEMSVLLPLRIYPNMPIAQIKFQEVKGEVLRPYGKRPGSKYQGQTGNQISLMHKNF
jgi:dCTP deaminase